MKLILYILIGCCMLHTTAVSTQNLNDLSGKESDSLIIWTKDRKLTWNDFKSKKSVRQNSFAYVKAGIILKPFYIDSNFSYKVIAVFKKNFSWKSKDNKGLLNHEQLHFDIAELFARKMRKEIFNQKKILSAEDYKIIYNKLNKEYKEYQKKYDHDTVHSIITEEQEKWEKKVAKELKELENYALKIED